MKALVNCIIFCLPGIVTLALAVLKLLGVISWSWIAVFAPLILSAVFVLLLLVLTIVIFSTTDSEDFV